jgi:hypothetical protein
MTLESDAEDNARYQRQLAAALAIQLGHDAAILACQEMAWHGALLHLLSERPDARRHHGPARQAQR